MLILPCCPRRSRRKDDAHVSALAVGSSISTGCMKFHQDVEKERGRSRSRERATQRAGEGGRWNNCCTLQTEAMASRERGCHCSSSRSQQSRGAPAAPYTIAHSRIPKPGQAMWMGFSAARAGACISSCKYLICSRLAKCTRGIDVRCRSKQGNRL